MAQTKNLCAQVPIDLHQKISEAREQAGLTTAQYITNLITEAMGIQLIAFFPSQQLSAAVCICFTIPKQESCKQKSSPKMKNLRG